jgi:hypothetical protein
MPAAAERWAASAAVKLSAHALPAANVSEPVLEQALQVAAFVLLEAIAPALAARHRAARWKLRHRWAGRQRWGRSPTVWRPELA